MRLLQHWFQSIYNLYYSKMLTSLPDLTISSPAKSHYSIETPHLKKKCLMIRKIHRIDQKSSLQTAPHRYFNVYNIIYFDVSSILNSVSQNSSFLHQIFKFQTIAKVNKTKDMTTLSLKLLPKISKSNLNEILMSCPVQLQKESLESQQTICEEKNSFRIVVQKIHNILHDQQASKQILQKESYNNPIYLPEQVVTKRTEQMISSRKYQNYIILENIFKLNCKKIKNIHISNSLLQTLGKLSSTLAFDILSNRSLPFNVFKQFDSKLFAQNSLAHFGRVLQQLFSKNTEKDEIKPERFQMKGVILTSDQQEKSVTVRWTCSHPSIILIELIDETCNAVDETQTSDSSSEEQNITQQFLNFKI